MLFTLNRKFCLVSLSGHAIQFEKDKPTDVPAHIAHEAMAIGAVAVESEMTPEHEEELKQVKEADPVKRAGEVLEAIKQIVERASRNDFAASGRPHAKAISKIVGYEVDSAERDKVWETYQQNTEA
jgi:hypothetical protein